MGGSASVPLSHRLAAAANENDVEAVAAVLADRPPAAADADSFTAVLQSALYSAASYGNVEMIRLLLAHGATPVHAVYNADPPICAAARGGHRPAVDVLLAAGARLDTVSRSYPGETPILAAAGAGEFDLARRLASAGAPLTTVEEAAVVGDVDRVRALLAAGAAVDGEVVLLEPDYESGWDGDVPGPDWSDDEGEPPLTVEALDSEAARRIADASGNAVAIALCEPPPEYQQLQLRSPLSEAVKAGQRGVVQALLSAGAAVAKPVYRSFDDSPLAWALGLPRSQWDIIRDVCRAGGPAMWRSVRSYGCRSFTTAAYYRDPSVEAPPMDDDAYGVDYASMDTVEGVPAAVAAYQPRIAADRADVIALLLDEAAAVGCIPDVTALSSLMFGGYAASLAVVLDAVAAGRARLQPHAALVGALMAAAYCGSCQVQLWLRVASEDDRRLAAHILSVMAAADDAPAVASLLASGVSATVAYTSDAVTALAPALMALVAPVATPPRMTPLYTAARCGAIGPMLLLIAGGAGVSSPGELFHMMPFAGPRATCEAVLLAALLAGTIKVTDFDPLVDAATQRTDLGVVVVAVLLRLLGPGTLTTHTVPMRERTLLGIALQYEMLPMIRALLDGGVSPNAPVGQGLRPLTHPAFNRRATFVRYLLEAGGDPNLADANGLTPLMAAAQLAHVEASRDCTRLLLAAGAKVDATDKDGATPLHYAAGARNVDTVRALLAAGANATARTHARLFGGGSETPADRMMRMYNMSRGMSEKREKLIRGLLEAAAAGTSPPPAPAPPPMPATAGDVAITMTAPAATAAAGAGAGTGAGAGARAYEPRPSSRLPPLREVIELELRGPLVAAGVTGPAVVSGLVKAVNLQIASLDIALARVAVTAVPGADFDAASVTVARVATATAAADGAVSVRVRITSIIAAGAVAGMVARRAVVSVAVPGSAAGTETEGPVSSALRQLSGDATITIAPAAAAAATIVPAAAATAATAALKCVALHVVPRADVMAGGGDA